MGWDRRGKGKDGIDGVEAHQSRNFSRHDVYAAGEQGKQACAGAALLECDEATRTASELDVGKAGRDSTVPARALDRGNECLLIVASWRTARGRRWRMWLKNRR